MEASVAGYWGDVSMNVFFLQNALTLKIRVQFTQACKWLAIESIHFCSL